MTKKAQELTINAINVAQYAVLTDAYLKLRELKNQRNTLDNQIKEQEEIVVALFVQEGITTANFIDQKLKLTYVEPTKTYKDDFDSTYNLYKDLLTEDQWWIMKKDYNADFIKQALGDKVIRKETNRKGYFKETDIK